MPKLVSREIKAEGVLPFDQIQRVRYEWAAPFCAPPILDIGCGCGVGTQMLFRLSGDAVGVDINPVAIQFAARYAPGPAYILGDIRKRPWIDDYGHDAFKTVVSLETIEHIDPAGGLYEYLKAIHDTLPHGGIFIGSTPNADVYPLERHRANQKDPNDLHYTHYTQSQLETVLEQADLPVYRWFGHRGQLLDQGKTADVAIRDGVDEETLFICWISVRR